MPNDELIDFKWKFHAPHRITLSRPSASKKTLVDADESGFVLSWSNHCLLDSVLNVWQQPKIEWRLRISVLIDGEKVKCTSWERSQNGFPEFIIHAGNEKCTVCFTGIAARTGDVIKLDVISAENHHVSVTVEHITGWVISNPAWIDGKNANCLMCMQGEISDKLLAVSFGAEQYSMPDQTAAKSITMEYFVSGGIKKHGFVIRPYEKFIRDIPALSQTDWEKEMEEAREEWNGILHKNAEFTIPDAKMNSAYLACLADLFVMREPMPQGNYGVCCGTEVYRSTNAGEPILTDMLFDALGYEKEAEEDIWLHINAYDESGNWNSPKGWSANCWFAAGFKAAMVMDHYKISGDRTFLENVYPIMKASSLWHYQKRCETKLDKNSPFFGLMPRGMGDCGLMNGNDYFGVFYPHNCYSVYADKMALEAAKILGKQEDIPILTEIAESAQADLIASLEKGAIDESDYRRIPGAAGLRCGSMWGAVFACTLGLLPFGHPLIQGTLKYIERQQSEGGLPVDLGWMKDGLWVAIALDNISALYLRQKLGDEAVKYLYPTVNHASPFVTWCEERGSEAGSERKSGDAQHLWTPLAVCRYIRDALSCNIDSHLCLASGTPRSWLSVGRSIGVKNSRVYNGVINYTISRESTDKINIYLQSDQLCSLGVIEIFLRIPETGLQVAVIEAADCEAVRAGSDKLIITPRNNAASVRVYLK